MYKITVASNRAFDAITWAKKQFHDDFDLDFDTSYWNYIFAFSDAEAATVFALKWAK